MARISSDLKQHSIDIASPLLNQKFPDRSRLASHFPVFFSRQYDLDFGTLVSSGPLDLSKRSKTALRLCGLAGIEPGYLSQPCELGSASFLAIHSYGYLQEIQEPRCAARIMQLAELADLSDRAIETRLLAPLRMAASGTLAACLASLEHGWAVNLSGGFHHAHRDRGAGFCFYNDIAFAVASIRRALPDLRVLVVDLDAHLGDGTLTCLAEDNYSFCYDIFNSDVFPRNRPTARERAFCYPIKSYSSDVEYLALLRATLPSVINVVRPDLIIYNAGADVHREDLLGRLSLSTEGVCQRDTIVRDLAAQGQVPICYLLSGAYSSGAWNVIAEGVFKAFSSDFRQFAAKEYI